jgi:hypothetical protein
MCVRDRFSERHLRDVFLDAVQGLSHG